MTPDDNTITEFFLEVGDNHKLYVQQWGNPAVKTPVLYLHGGPGNGVDNGDKRKFDPKKHRVYFFDQRGSGKSEYGELLNANTTRYLIDDIASLARHEALDSFILVGSSWGSTLAFAYGIAHPEMVAAMVLDGIFLGSSREISWLDQGGWRNFFPDVWEEFTQSVPPPYRENPAEYLLDQALNAQEEDAKKAVYDYLKMELALLKLDDRLNPPDYETFNPAGGKVEMHYLANNCFLEDGHILRNAHKLAMPVYLLQGRYDFVCPPETAYRLHAALPNSKLLWTINGHLKQHEAKNILSLLVDQLSEAR